MIGFRSTNGYELPFMERDFNSIFAESIENRSDNDLVLPSPFELNNIESPYWDTENVNKEIDLNYFRNFFLHINIQGLQHKFDNFITFLNSLTNQKEHYLPAVIALSETWLNKNNATSFEIPGFHPLVAKCRDDNRDRGGVRIYIRNDIEYNEQPDLNIFIPFVFESTFVTLKPSNINVGIIYRTPDSNASDFLSHFEVALQSLQNARQQFILLGDFNLDLFKFSSDPMVTEFVNMIFEYSGIPVITKPTRVGPTSATCLDNIIISKVNSLSYSGICIEDISDHFPVFYCFSDESHKATNKTANHDNNHNFQVPNNFSKQNLKKLKSELGKQTWSTVLSEEDPSIAADLLNATITYTIQDTCPPATGKTYNKKCKPNQPWFTAGLKTSSKRKNKLYKKTLKAKKYLPFYRRYRNIYNCLIRLAKKNYYGKKLLNAKNDMRKTWQIFTEIMSKPKPQNVAPKELTLNQPDSFSTSLTEPNQIADFFNNFFASVGLRTSASSSQDIDPLDFMEVPDFRDSLFFVPTNKKEIIDLTLSLKSKSSSGHDNISNILLKEIIPLISVPLTHIFNLSLQTGSVPQTYKLAKVIPIYKGGD